MTTFNIFHTTRVGIGVRDAPHIWGAGEIRDAGERRLFGGLARSEPFVTPHVWGTGEMSTEISAPYPGRWGNKHWKSRRIYVALGHDELKRSTFRNITHCVVFVKSDTFQLPLKWCIPLRPVSRWRAPVTRSIPSVPIENLKTMSMEDVSTRVLWKIKNI